VVYAPETVDRYPRHDSVGLAFPVKIESFCFPNGTRLGRVFVEPQQFNFILTNELNVRIYCSALVLTEQLASGAAGSAIRHQLPIEAEVF